MRIPVFYLVLAVGLLTAVPIFVHARKIGRRSPAFDFLIAACIPLLGAMMYVSSVRMGLTPPPLDANGDVVATGANESPEVRAAAAAAALRRARANPAEPSPSLMAELTAELRRVQAELEQTRAELAQAQAALKSGDSPLA